MAAVGVEGAADGVGDDVGVLAGDQRELVADLDLLCVAHAGRGVGEWVAVGVGDAGDVDVVGAQGAGGAIGQARLIGDTWRLAIDAPEEVAEDAVLLEEVEVDVDALGSVDDGVVVDLVGGVEGGDLPAGVGGIGGREAAVGLIGGALGDGGGGEDDHGAQRVGERHPHYGGECPGCPSERSPHRAILAREGKRRASAFSWALLGGRTVASTSALRWVPLGVWGAYTRSPPGVGPHPRPLSHAVGEGSHALAGAPGGLDRGPLWGWVVVTRGLANGQATAGSVRSVVGSAGVGPSPPAPLPPRWERGVMRWPERRGRLDGGPLSAVGGSHPRPCKWASDRRVGALGRGGLSGVGPSPPAPLPPRWERGVMRQGTTKVFVKLVALPLTLTKVFVESVSRRQLRRQRGPG